MEKRQLTASVKKYVNKMENRITVKIKKRILSWTFNSWNNESKSTKSKIKKDKNGENIPYLEITEVVLIHCNFVDNSYLQNSWVLCTFNPNKSFRQLLDISPENFKLLKTFYS